MGIVVVCGGRDKGIMRAVCEGVAAGNGLSIGLLPGDLKAIEFIVGTGFEGDIALPSDIARQLDATHAGSVVRLLRMAFLTVAQRLNSRWTTRSSAV